MDDGKRRASRRPPDQMISLKDSAAGKAESVKEADQTALDRMEE